MENTKTTFRPILFSTPMVQAILEGRKTMTRRVVKPQPESIDFYEDRNVWFPAVSKCPYEVGDILWVRETHRALVDCATGEFAYWSYKADMPDDFHKQYPHKWKSSLFMPKSACRIFLRIKSIRVERLNTISADDIIKEGVRIPVSNKSNGNNKVVFILGMDNSALSFLPNGCMAEGAPKLNQNQLLNAFWAELWCSINGRASWNQNPFVFVYEFERIEKPLDFIV